MTLIPVLLVDDNPAFLRTEIILLDLAMPGLSCPEAIHRLRAALPNAGIIVLTILDFSSYRQAVIAAGADGFVPKAIMGADLLPTIQHVVQPGQYRQKLTEDGFLEGNYSDD